MFMMLSVSLLFTSHDEAISFVIVGIELGSCIFVLTRMELHLLVLGLSTSLLAYLSLSITKTLKLKLCQTKFNVIFET